MTVNGILPVYEESVELNRRPLREDGGFFICSIPRRMWQGER
jgi:hypothetical protein